MTIPIYPKCHHTFSYSMKKSLNKTVIHNIHYVIYYCDYVCEQRSMFKMNIRRKKIRILVWFGSNSKNL